MRKPVRMRSIAIVLWVLVLATLVSVASSNAARPAATGGRPPALLILHGGGFIFEDEARMRRARRLAIRFGFDPVYVDYPLFDLQGAVTAAEDRARELAAGGRAVFAYGESVGGTLAGLLAARGLVAGAATYSPVADMRAFASHSPDPAYYRALIGAERADLLHASPVVHLSRCPILVLRAAADLGFMRRGMGRWERRDTQVELQPVPGRHIGAGQVAVYLHNARFAMRWLRRLAFADPR